VLQHLQLRKAAAANEEATFRAPGTHQPQLYGQMYHSVEQVRHGDGRNCSTSQQPRDPRTKDQIGKGAEPATIKTSTDGAVVTRTPTVKQIVTVLWTAEAEYEGHSSTSLSQYIHHTFDLSTSITPFPF
jgi:hypothetical protein